MNRRVRLALLLPVLLLPTCTHSNGEFDWTKVDDQLTSDDYKQDKLTDLTRFVDFLAIGESATGTFVENEFVSYQFNGKKGASVRIALDSADSDAILALYGPRTPSNAWTARLGKGDDEEGSNARLQVTLPADGRYLIVAGNAELAPGSYALQLGDGGPACVPKSCAEQTKDCGSIDDGCGRTLACGSCTAPAECGGAGLPNVCGVSLPVTFTVTGYIVGNSATSAASAATSWQSECDDWVTGVRNQAGLSLEIGAHDCGEKKDIGGSDYRYVSQPTIQLTAVLPGGRAPEVVKSPPVSGEASQERGLALKSWILACNGGVSGAAVAHGERFLAAGCNEPYDEDPGDGFRFASTARVWLSPSAVESEPASIDVDGFLVAGSAGSADAATASWTVACEDWKARQANLSGGNVTTHECGMKSDVGGSDYRYASTMRDVIALMVPKGRPPRRSKPELVTGEPATVRGDAYASWMAACREAVENKFAALGLSLGASACERPYDADGGPGFKFVSALKVWSIPTTAWEPESVTFTANTFVVGDTASGADPATQSWTSACTDLPARVTTYTEADVTSSMFGAKTDVGGSDYRFVSPATLELKVTIPKGRTVKTAKPESVSGTQEAVRGTAYATWQEACVARLAEMRGAIGGDYLAAVCEEPYNSATGGAFKFTSPIRVWSLAPLSP